VVLEGHYNRSCCYVGMHIYYFFGLNPIVVVGLNTHACMGSDPTVG
jgi:hypothetical protein